VTRANPWYRWDGPDLILEIHVQPRASREGYAGVTEHGLKIRLTAPPVDGEANLALQRWLADQFRVSKGQIVLEQGLTGRHKRVRVRAPRRLPDELGIKKP
jgi:uncharacterized protein (TIGR00251 family)